MSKFHSAPAEELEDKFFHFSCSPRTAETCGEHDRGLFTSKFGKKVDMLDMLTNLTNENFVHLQMKLQSQKLTCCACVWRRARRTSRRGQNAHSQKLPVPLAFLAVASQHRPRARRRKPTRSCKATSLFAVPEAAMRVRLTLSLLLYIYIYYIYTYI